MTGGDEKARDEAAIRTAIMLGATIRREEQPLGPLSRWSGYAYAVYTIEGIDHRSLTPAGVAWLYLAIHGIGIDVDGKPYPFARSSKQ